MTAAVEVLEESGDARAGEAWPPGSVVRDITRGGVAGLIAGVLVAGVGGRIAMRIAAIAVPDATGAFTENGNRIGAITLGGSLGLIIGGGLVIGFGAGFVWVTVRPWIPGGTAVRALLAMPIAVALGSIGLIQGENPDFEVLERQPGIVAILVALVMLVGLAIALIDAWLDRRLPQAPTLESGPAGIYSVVTVIGLFIGLPLVIPAYLGQEHRWLGIMLIAVGVATLASWLYRVRRRELPRIVAALGYGALAAAIVIGFAGTWSEIAFALRI
jgi:hypothetical protein